MKEKNERTRTKHLKYLYPSYRGKFGQTMYSRAYLVYIQKGIYYYFVGEEFYAKRH